MIKLLKVKSALKMKIQQISVHNRTIIKLHEIMVTLSDHKGLQALAVGSTNSAARMIHQSFCHQLLQNASS
jgi:hypothetical protein